MKKIIVGIFFFIGMNSYGQNKKKEVYYTKLSEINTVEEDFGVTYFGVEYIVLTSNSINLDGLDEKQIKARKKKGNLYNLYYASVSKYNIVANKKLIKNGMPEGSNYSFAVFSNDLSVVYFTDNNNLFRADVKSVGVWENITKLGINKGNYNYAHPALSRDNRTLYFASDMAGTLGGMDIFKATINYDGTVTNPKNMGKNINSEKNELFPFVDVESNLYFSSNREGGLGGLDVYKINLKNQNKLFHLPEPINSTSDDFSFIINYDNRGFFSSNRKYGKGKDDVYSFVKMMKSGSEEELVNEKVAIKKCEQEISGVIKDLKTGAIIKKASLVLLDDKANNVEEITSNRRGEYQFKIHCNSDYTLKVVKKEYDLMEYKFHSETEPEIKQDIKLMPVPIVKVKKDLSKSECQAMLHKIDKIDFDLNQFNVTEDTSKKLTKVIDVLYKCPKIIVEIASHTDSRGSYAASLSLTQQRANAMVNYILENSKVSPDNIYGIGYGETQLLNNCKDGKHCSEKEHEVNRRVTFTVK